VGYQYSTGYFVFIRRFGLTGKWLKRDAVDDADSADDKVGLQRLEECCQHSRIEVTVPVGSLQRHDGPQQRQLLQDDQNDWGKTDDVGGGVDDGDDPESHRLEIASEQQDECDKLSKFVVSIYQCFLR
jgi:hypothetical protein